MSGSNDGKNGSFSSRLRLVCFQISENRSSSKVSLISSNHVQVFICYLCKAPKISFALLSLPSQAYLADVVGGRKFFFRLLLYSLTSSVFTSKHFVYFQPQQPVSISAITFHLESNIPQLCPFH